MNFNMFAQIGRVRTPIVTSGPSARIRLIIGMRSDVLLETRIAFEGLPALWPLATEVAFIDMNQFVRLQAASGRTLVVASWPIARVLNAQVDLIYVQGQNLLSLIALLAAFVRAAEVAFSDVNSPHVFDNVSIVAESL